MMASNPKVLDIVPSMASTSISEGQPITPTAQQCHIQRLPMDIQGMIWEYVWHARTVTVHRRIVKHNSDPRRNVQAAKTSLKQARAKRSRRKHRDKVLHSNAVMQTNWNGKPAVPAADKGVTVGLKYSLRTDVPTRPFQASVQTPHGYIWVGTKPPVNPRHLGAALAPPKPDTVPAWKVTELQAARRQMSHYERQRHDRDEATLPYDLKRVTTLTTGDCPNPVSLWVNRDSREYTLMKYQLAFALPGGSTLVYFNFRIDTLNIPRHIQLWRAFTKNDLSKLQFVRVPEAFVDNSGDHVAVGTVVDKLFFTDEDGNAMATSDGLNWLPGKTPDKSQGELLESQSANKQMAWQLQDVREIMDALMPSLKVLHIAGYHTCTYPQNGYGKCHISHIVNPEMPPELQPFRYIIDMARVSPPEINLWATLATKPAAAPLEQRPCLARVGRNLNNTGPLPRQEADDQGYLVPVEVPLREGCVVRMMGIDHGAIATLENWEAQLRIPPWGRHMAQAKCVDENLRMLLELGATGKRRCETLDYEI